MTGWLIALAVLAVLWLLGRIRLGVRARYEEGKAEVRLLIGPVKIALYPPKERAEKADRPEKRLRRRPPGERHRQGPEADRRRVRPTESLFGIRKARKSGPV